MKAQTAAYLAAADQAVSNARRILAIDIPSQAARLAYYGQFHAAQALIFERTGKVAKTHKGVDTQFHQLTKTEQALTPGLAGELSTAYRFKEIADYDVGTAAPITPAEAQDAIATAYGRALRYRHPPGSDTATPGACSVGETVTC